MLADKETEYRRTPDKHDHQRFLAIYDIKHEEQTNGTFERLHQRILIEFYQTAFRKKPAKAIPISNPSAYLKCCVSSA